MLDTTCWCLHSAVHIPSYLIDVLASVMVFVKRNSLSSVGVLVLISSLLLIAPVRVGDGCCSEEKLLVCRRFGCWGLTGVCCCGCCRYRWRMNEYSALQSLVAAPVFSEHLKPRQFFRSSSERVKPRLWNKTVIFNGWEGSELNIWFD